MNFCTTGPCARVCDTVNAVRTKRCGVMFCDIAHPCLAGKNRAAVESVSPRCRFETLGSAGGLNRRKMGWVVEFSNIGFGGSIDQAGDRLGERIHPAARRLGGYINDLDGAV
eukprot:10924398-Lingulodinium_polyedra.AAC.1